MEYDIPDVGRVAMWMNTISPIQMQALIRDLYKGLEVRDKENEELKLEVAKLDEKWRHYENEYILPCFKWAEELGLDLQQMVYDNPGHNCVELFFKYLMEE